MRSVKPISPGRIASRAQAVSRALSATIAIIRSDPIRLNQGMRAMVLEAPGEELVERELPDPEPGAGQVLLEVWTCGDCRYCRSDRENLCERARFTGYQLDGGYAERAVADERFCFPVPSGYPDAQAAPLLCAGLIGYRSLRLAGDAERLGLYGFGASAHIICQVAVSQGRHVFAFTKEGASEAQALARELGAEWAGPVGDPEVGDLDAAIIFAPVGELVPEALRATAAGATVVCAGIHMSDIPAFPYELLWRERAVRSVANLTRRDGEEFMSLAPAVPVQTQVQPYALSDADLALNDLR